MQPIMVRPIANGRYEIIAGERRWRASQQAGLEKIPALVRDVPDEAAIAMALIENIQREDLNPIEEAAALQRLQQEFQLTQQQVAEAVGKSRATITNLLRLIGLPEEIKTLLSPWRPGDGAMPVRSSVCRQNGRWKGATCCRTWA